MKVLEIEGALQEWFSTSWDTSAPPIPENLGETLPHVHIRRQGGSDSTKVSDMHYVTFDVYAQTWAQAQRYASELTRQVRELEGENIGVPVYGVQITTFPYNNLDPRHETLARVSFLAYITCRIDER